MAYKMTKGSVSVIRKDAAGVKQAEAAGFVLEGECDNDGALVPSQPKEQPKPKKAKG